MSDVTVKAGQRWVRRDEGEGGTVVAFSARVHRVGRGGLHLCACATPSGDEFRWVALTHEGYTLDETDPATLGTLCHDERAAWQEASGLLVGGDPDGVEPRHLERFVGLSAALEEAARRVLGDAHSVLTTEDAGSALWDLRVAIRALDALDAFAREEGSPDCRTNPPRVSAPSQTPLIRRRTMTTTATTRRGGMRKVWQWFWMRVWCAAERWGVRLSWPHIVFGWAIGARPAVRDSAAEAERDSGDEG